MSFVYLPEGCENLASFLAREVASSDQFSSDGKSSVMLNSINIANKSSNKESETASMTMPLSSEISGASTEPRTEDTSMSSQRGSRDRVNPSRSQVNELESTTSVICGPKHSASFAKYDPDTHSLKTSPGLFPVDILEPSSVTLPKVGMMRNGVCWERTMSEHRIDGSDSGYWPTPRVCAGLRSSGANRTEFYDRMYPTPKANEHKGGISSKGGLSLGHMATHARWPTPGTQECTGGPSNPEKLKAQKHQIKLKDAVSESLGGTPTRQTYLTPKCPSGGGCERNTPGGGLRKLEDQVAMKGPLNPDWVCWLMNWPKGLTSLEPMSQDTFREWLMGCGIEFKD